MIIDIVISLFAALEDVMHCQTADVTFILEALQNLKLMECFSPTLAVTMRHESGRMSNIDQQEVQNDTEQEIQDHLKHDVKQNMQRMQDDMQHVQHYMHPPSDKTQSFGHRPSNQDTIQSRQCKEIMSSYENRLLRKLIVELFSSLRSLY